MIILYEADVLSVCVCAYMYVCIPYTHQVPLEARRRQWIPWKLEL